VREEFKKKIAFDQTRPLYSQPTKDDDDNEERLAPNAAHPFSRDKAGRLTYVGKPSRLAPGGGNRPPKKALVGDRSHSHIKRLGTGHKSADCRSAPHPWILCLRPNEARNI
jgi:hypothetical protein